MTVSAALPLPRDPVELDDWLAAAEVHLRAGGFGDLAAAVAVMRDGGGGFEAALGLTARGGSSWRQRVRCARRDRAYEALAELIASGRSALARATAAERVVARYESTKWRADRHKRRDDLPVGDLQRLLAFDVLSSGVRPLGTRALRQLFEKHDEKLAETGALECQLSSGQ